MTFESLREFYIVAQTLSYAEAAEQLFVSETALSRHIKKLEEELGAPLFYRTTRRVVLTPLGEQLLPYAEKSMELKTEIHTVLASHLRNEKIHLVISAINITNQYIDLIDLIAKFNLQYPNVSIDLITSNRSVSDLAAHDSCELNFAPELAGYTDNNFNRILIRHDQIIAFVPQAHPLATKKVLSLEDLKNERLILISKGSPLFNLCIQACQNHGFTPNVVITMANGSNIRTIVESGNGIGLLLEYPSMQLHDDFPGGTKVVFREFQPSVQVDFNLICKPHLSSASRAFLAFTREYLDHRSS